MEKEIHDIHNYIRNHTKISNEDKGLFIGGILIALKDNTFKEIVKNSICDDISLVIITNLKKYNLNIEEVYYSLNNEHLLKITIMVKKILENTDDIDLINSFYNEFVKYQNNDGKSLGIVLTPPHIIELMVKLLKIKKK